MGIKSLFKKPFNLGKLEPFDPGKIKIQVSEWRQFTGAPLRYYAAVKGFEGLGIGEGRSAVEAERNLRKMLPRSEGGMRIDGRRGPARANDLWDALAEFGFGRAKLAGRPIILEHQKSKRQIVWRWSDDDFMGPPVIEFIAAAAGVSVAVLEGAAGITAARAHEAEVAAHIEKVQAEAIAAANKARKAAEAAEAKRLAEAYRKQAEDAERAVAEMEGSDAA